MYKESKVQVVDNPHLRDDQFALITDDLRLFPVDNPQSVYDSIQEFDKFAEDFGEKEKRTAASVLKKYASLYAVPTTYSIEKNASSDVYTNRIKGENVRPIQKQAQYNTFALKGHWPLDTPSLVKKAFSYIEEYKTQFEPQDRKEFAKNVQKQAEAFNLDTPFIIKKAASDTYDDSARLKTAARKNFVNDKYYHSYEKLAEYAGAIPPSDFVSLLTELDKKAGVDKLYNRKGIEDPYLTVYGLSKQSNTYEYNGDNISEAQLIEALDNQYVRRIIGEGNIAMLKKKPEIFDSLPDPEKEVIFSYAK